MENCFRIKSYKKISEQKGETIAEVLISLVISSLALILLAGSITTTSRIVKKGQDKIEEFYSANNLMIEGGSNSYVSAGSGSIILNSGSVSYDSWNVSYYYHNRFNRESVILYHK